MAAIRILLYECHVCLHLPHFNFQSAWRQSIAKPDGRTRAGASEDQRGAPEEAAKHILGCLLCSWAAVGHCRIILD